MFNFISPELYLGIISWVEKVSTKTGTQTKKVIEKTSESWIFNSFESFWQTVLKILIFIALFFLILKIVRIVSEILTARKFVYLKVTLPRADSKLDKERETKKDFKEKIGIMSMLYKSIHKIWDTDLWETLTNFIFKHSRVSLEIVYNEWQINFFIVTLDKYLELITQQITSNYPDAEVAIVNKKDYPEIKPRWYTLKAASFHKIKDNIFPIKTYKYSEDDPLNTFTNNFWALEKTDRAAFQIVIKPLKWNWNNRAKKSARLVAKWQYKSFWWGWVFNIIWKILFPISWLMYRFVKNENDPSDPLTSGAPGAGSWDSYKIFNQAEQETQKVIWECAGQPRFLTSAKFLVSSKTNKSAWIGLNNLITSTNIFTDEYNNKLDNPQVLEDLFSFIVTPIRYFTFKLRLTWIMQRESAFSTDEMSSMYHFPDINYNKSPIITWLTYKMLPTPSNLKIPKEPMILPDYKRDDKWNIITEDGTKLAVDKYGNLRRDEQKNFITTEWKIIEIIKDWENKWKPNDSWKMPISENKQRFLSGFPLYKDATLMGWNEYRNKNTPIYFDRKDRGRHHYIIWKSWGWKSVFIGYMARQDLWNWDWLCVIDPHWDLVEDVVAYTPKERIKDVTIFNPGDYERPMWLNLLEVVTQWNPEKQAMEKDRAAMDATSIFIKIFWDEIFGPRIQHYFRNWCLTLMDDEEDGGTLIDVPRLFVDDAFMRYKVSKVKNPVVKSFWDYEYANTWDREKQEMIPYFSSKFWPFITNTTIRNIIWQTKSAFNFRDIMDNQKVLMVNLSKWLIWDLNAQLLWLIFVSKINMAAMSRADMAEEDRKDFFLYVDEFQNFATETFWEILSEARKYRLALIMAHQFIAQIWGSWSKQDKWWKPSIKDAVFWNAWTIMSFKVWAEDAEYLEKEYAPTLSQQDIIGIANYTAYCKLNIDNATSRPFDMKTIWDNYYKNTNVSKIVKEYSRNMYGRKKEFVDMEIEARLWIIKD